MAEVTNSSSATPTPTPSPAPAPAPSAAPTGAAPSPSPSPAPSATASALTSDASKDGPLASPTDWPVDWRDKLAGADDKLKTRLGRFQSPADLLKSYTQLETKLSSGQLKAALPADATPEDTARWRQENGIPEKPDGYLATLEKGIVVKDADKKLVGVVLADMHAKNASPEAVGAALGAWNKVRETIEAERSAGDATAKTWTEDELRQEWGSDYRRNINVINGWLDTAPKGVKDGILNARLHDGTPLASHPDTLRFLMTAATQANPAATVVPGSTANSSTTIDSEIATIEKTMREKRADYDRDPKMQARYLDLIRARESLQKGRAA